MRARVLVPVLVVFAVMTAAAPAPAGPVEQQILFTTKHALAIPRTYTLRFSLWTDPDDTDEGLSMAWSEQTSVELTTGRISHYLGSVDPAGNPLELAGFSRQLWVQVDRWKKKSSSWAPVTARRSMLKLVPYAMHSQGVADGSVNSLSIQDGSVAADDLQDGTAIAEIADDDGAGSGLDADVLDGQQGSFYRGWGNLTGVPAGFADGVDDTGGEYANVVNVAKSGGDFTGIQAAVDGITDAAADNPYLVRVAPGVYTGPVTMKPYVHLQGAGQDVTVITSSVTNDSLPPTAATLVLDDHVSVRGLTVENDGIGTHDVAVLARDGAAPVLVSEVTARARNGVNNYAVFVTGSSIDATLSHVTALSQNGSSGNFGLFTESGARALLESGSFTGDGGTDAFGVYVIGAATGLKARGIAATGQNSTWANGGLFNIAGATTLLEYGSFTADGGQFAYGLQNAVGGATLEAQGVSSTGRNGSLGNFGLRNVTQARALLRGGSFTGDGGTGQATGILNIGATLEAYGVSSTGQSSPLTYGLYNENGAAASLHDGSFTADGGTTACGIYNTDPATTLEALGVTATGRNAASGNFGVRTAATAIFTHSLLEGSTSCVNVAAGTAEIRNSRLEGGPLMGTATCLLVSRGATASLDTCP